MLVVLAKAKVSDGALASARDAIAAMVEASNAEDGCLAYTFTQDLLDPQILHIVEKWQSEEALATHFQTKHMAEFGAAIADLDVTILEVIKYKADDGTALI